MNATVIALDHIVLLVRDVEASLRFYGGALGMPAERVEEWRQGKAPFPSLRVSESTLIDLFPRSEDAGHGVNLDHFCLVLETDDLESVCQALERAGATIEDPVIASRWGARGWSGSFRVQDPDGNRIEVKSYSRPA